MKTLAQILALLLAVTLPGAANAQVRLTDVVTFGADASGSVLFQPDVWETRPGGNFDNWLQSLPSGTFLNGPSDAAVQPNITLVPGTNSFRVYTSPGIDNANFGINLFFNDAQTPSISAFGPMLTDTNQIHSFAADSASPTPTPVPVLNSGIPGAGTLTFETSNQVITLTDFYLATPSVFNLDQASQMSLGPDGVMDYVGGFTLVVSNKNNSSDCTPAPAGLVAWWPGDGNANDVFGVNNGTFVGSISYAPGEVGQSFNFDGVTGGVQIPDSPMLSFTNELTVEFWYKDTGSVIDYGLVTKRPVFVGACNFGINVLLDSSQVLQVFFEESTSGTFQISAVPVPTAGVFHHVAATYRQATATQVEVQTFIDGQLVKTATLSGNLANTVNSQPVSIGCDSLNHDNLKGEIDEVSLYNRILSTNEIAAIYNAGSAGKCASQTGLSHQLINIDFGASGGRGYSLKTGLAAIGGATNDFWNFYDRDASSTPGDWRNSGTLVNLKLADGGMTTVGMSVSDAPGAWNDASSDPMYKTFIYPLDGGTNFITFTNLPPGRYDVLAYSPDGSYEVTVGGTSYGIKTSYDDPASSVPVWTEGVQYARWQNVQLAAGQALVLASHPNTQGKQFLSGMQIVNKTPVNAECTPTPAGLVAWWPGEGNLYDCIGTNNGIASSGLTYTNGEVGSACAMNSYNSYFHVPASPALNVGAGDGLTIETWIKPSTVNGLQPIVEWNDEVGQAIGVQFWIGQYPWSQGVLCASFLETNVNNYIQVPSPSGTLVANTWQHVAVTYDRTSHVIKVYVNGAVVGQSTWSGDVPLTSYNFWVGRRPEDCGGGCWTDGAYLSGPLDELSLYNRALSQTEIAAIYNAGSAGKCQSVASIIQQPLNQTTVTGSGATLSVGLGGIGPFTYQWRFNGANISGATNATLTLANLHSNQSGHYSVVITTPDGTLISSDAIVTVIAQDILVYSYSGKEQITTFSQDLAYNYSGQMLLIPAGTNGTFVGWAIINGKKQYWVSPLTGYLWINIARKNGHNYTVLGRAGDGIDPNGYPHLWSSLHRGVNTPLAIAKKRTFSFPNTFSCVDNHIYPDTNTGNIIMVDANSTYQFTSANTQTANNTGQTLTDLVNALTKSLEKQGYQKQ